jgi:plasmid stability protein
VLIRNVPRKPLEALRKRAAAEGRSLQQELRLVIEQAGERASFDYVEAARRLQERLLKRGGPWSDSAELIRRGRRR